MDLLFHSRTDNLKVFFTKKYHIENELYTSSMLNLRSYKKQNRLYNTGIRYICYIIQIEFVTDAKLCRRTKFPYTKLYLIIVMYFGILHVFTRVGPDLVFLAGCRMPDVRYLPDPAGYAGYPAG